MCKRWHDWPLPLSSALSFCSFIFHERRKLVWHLPDPIMHFMMNSTLHVNQKVNSIQSQVGMIDYPMYLLLFQIMLCINNLSKLWSFSYLYKKKHPWDYLLHLQSHSIHQWRNWLIPNNIEKLLDLFECEPQLRTDNSVNMAIKACTELHDYERGKTIIKQLSADSFSNQFTQKSLLQFYSKLFVLIFRTIYRIRDTWKRIFHVNVLFSFHSIRCIWRDFILSTM
jgi:hypothetical protein